jgi:8-oxo-dGTP pyrophosphatase MutT (NUDIX family)
MDAAPAAPTAAPAVTDRVAARVLLVDDEERLLLMRCEDPARPGDHYWVTPGGGLDDGETASDAVRRELFEETGLRITAEQLGPPVHREVSYFSYRERDYAQQQTFFLVRVPNWEPDTSGFDEDEVGTVSELRWWFVNDLHSTGERIFPADLVEVLERLEIG